MIVNEKIFQYFHNSIRCSGKERQILSMLKIWGCVLTSNICLIIILQDILKITFGYRFYKPTNKCCFVGQFIVILQFDLPKSKRTRDRTQRMGSLRDKKVINKYNNLVPIPQAPRQSIRIYKPSQLNGFELYDYVIELHLIIRKK